MQVELLRRTAIDCARSAPARACALRWLMASTALNAFVVPAFVVFGTAVEPGDAAGLVFHAVRVGLIAVCAAGWLVGLALSWTYLSTVGFSSTPELVRLTKGGLCCLVGLHVFAALSPSTILLRALAPLVFVGLACTLISIDLMLSTNRLTLLGLFCLMITLACAAQVAWCREQVFVTTVLLDESLANSGRLSLMAMFCAIVAMRSLRSATWRQRLLPLLPALGLTALLGLVLSAAPSDYTPILLKTIGWFGAEPRMLLATAFAAAATIACPFNADERERVIARALTLIALCGWGWAAPWQQLATLIGLMELRESGFWRAPAEARELAA